MHRQGDGVGQKEGHRATHLQKLKMLTSSVATHTQAEAVTLLTPMAAASVCSLP